MPEETYRLSRQTDPRERENPRYPLAPLNMFVTTPDVGVNDIRWDVPTQILGNGKFQIIGVNIYRSYDSQFGPFTKINPIPIGASFYRDSTQNQAVFEEDVSDKFLARGTDHPQGLWILRPEFYPVVKVGSQAITANSPSDVVLKIDGVAVPVSSVRGQTGEVFLNQARIWDNVKRKIVEPILPTDDSVVTLSYRYNNGLVTNQLAQRIFYKITTVGTLDSKELETPLDTVEGVSAYEIEKLDYIWKEAIRRNRWILEQGGEAVKVFIRKWIGVRCSCWSDIHNQGENDCLQCFGTQIVGGYEGPVDILIAPQDGERRVELTQNGMQVIHSYEVWTGPTPLLSQRDFIVKQNNDRYSIGPVNVPSNRGTVLQQHFAIGYLDEKDIRYKIPANPDALRRLSYSQTRYKNFEKPVTLGTGYPMVTDNPNTPEGTQDRGRSPTYGRIVR